MPYSLQSGLQHCLQQHWLSWCCDVFQPDGMSSHPNMKVASLFPMHHLGWNCRRHCHWLGIVSPLPWCIENLDLMTDGATLCTLCTCSVQWWLLMVGVARDFLVKTKTIMPYSNACRKSCNHPAPKGAPWQPCYLSEYQDNQIPIALNPLPVTPIIQPLMAVQKSQFLLKLCFVYT